MDIGWDRRHRRVLNVLASDPGTGKTRFALDIARRLWFRLPWPDNQPNELLREVPDALGCKAIGNFG